MSLILLEFQNRLLKVNVGLSFWYLVLCCLESANFAGLFVKNKEGETSAGCYEGDDPQQEFFTL